MFDLDYPEIQFALNVTRRASLLVRQVQAELVTPALTKDDRSPVTLADYAAQALVGRLLAQAFPQDWLVAEEDSSALRTPEVRQALQQVTHFVRRNLPDATPETVCDWIDHRRTDSASRFWTLDPIDGTRGFLRGDQYAIVLALVVHGCVQIGVLGCPYLTRAQQPDLNGPGSLVTAVRDAGTWTTSLTSPGDFQQLQVSTQAEPTKARLLRSFESGHTNVSQIDTLAQVLGIQAEPVLMDSQAKYVVLAAGKGDLMLRLLSASQPNYREKIWDQAAGSLVLEEAGGQITDLDGKPLDFTTGRSLKENRGILASNRLLHASTLSALRQISA